MRATCRVEPRSKVERMKMIIGTASAGGALLWCVAHGVMPNLSVEQRSTRAVPALSSPQHEMRGAVVVVEDGVLDRRARAGHLHCRAEVVSRIAERAAGQAHLAQHALIVGPAHEAVER